MPKQDKDTREQGRNGAKNIPPVQPGKSPWIVLLVVAGVFTAMQLMSARPGGQVADISQAEFRAAVEKGQVAEVKRIRDLGSGSTSLEGRFKPAKAVQAAKAQISQELQNPGKNEQNGQVAAGEGLAAGKMPALPGAGSDSGNSSQDSVNPVNSGDTGAGDDSVKSRFGWAGRLSRAILGIEEPVGRNAAAPQNGVPQKGGAFRVRLVPGENERLMQFIDDKGLPCPVEEREPVMGPFLMQLFWLVAMAGIFWFLFYRKIGRGFTMGKSKTKLLSEDKNKVTFANVAGADEAKEETGEIIEFLKAPEKFTKLGGRIPKGVLLVGPPGTGKTLLARAIAGEANVPFFSISGSDFEEMFVGVGASRVRDMFEQGKKNAPCLIFIDEIDSVGHKRNDGTTALTHTNDQTLNAMLVEMDGFDANEGVIIIAATNRPDILDPALLRPGRFDRQIYMDLPTLKGREEILRLHGSKVKLGPDADLSRIARGTPGFSGADLANLVNEAALLAARANLDSIPHYILEEARDKVLWGRERRSAGYSKKERETTAWHEAGHALLQLLLPDTDPLHKVTIIPRGRALGATMSLPDHDVLNRTRSQFRDEIAVCAGGRIAESFLTNDISTGAAQDIREATRIARGMVCRFGMSDKFGFQAFQNPNPFAAEESPPPYSAETSAAIDAEVKALIDEGYARAKALLEANRDKLELLANTLLEKETMDGRDIEKLLGIPPRKREEEPEEVENPISQDQQNLEENQQNGGSGSAADSVNPGSDSVNPVKSRPQAPEGEAGN